MGKAWGTAVILATTLAVLAPIHEGYRGSVPDSFPFSWYPMFSRPRPDPEFSNYVVGFDNRGGRTLIHSRYYVGGGMNQARRQLDYLISNKRTARETCERAAANVARSKDKKFASLTRIRIVRGWFHMREYFEKGNKLPVKEKTYVQCRIMRGDGATGPAPTRMKQPVSPMGTNKSGGT